jgi:hypothetical protein
MDRNDIANPAHCKSEFAFDLCGGVRQLQVRQAKHLQPSVETFTLHIQIRPDGLHPDRSCDETSGKPLL